MKLFNFIDFDLEKDFLAFYSFIRQLFRKRNSYDKSNAFILFVDDEQFPVVENLKKSGWNVDVVKDIADIDDLSVRRAHLIFIDNKGVGKILSENDEGIGLAKLIKKTYGDKKRIILYSGYLVSLGSYLSIIDNQLPKNSDTYEFEIMIKDELTKLK